jgi:hypothetical protein
MDNYYQPFAIESVILVYELPGARFPFIWRKKHSRGKYDK